MSKEEKNINYISFGKIARIVIKSNRFCLYIISIITVIMLLVTEDIKSSIIGLGIYFFGFVGSVVIHEYMHVLCMKRYGVQLVEVDVNLFKFAIKTKEKLSGLSLVITAASGSMVCCLIGMVGIVLNVIYPNIIIEILSFCFLFHIINFVPLWGDGKMILKGLFSAKLEDRGRDNEK